MFNFGQTKIDLLLCSHTEVIFNVLNADGIRFNVPHCEANKQHFVIYEVACCGTSTSFIMGTGLKKCRPPKRSSLEVALAMSPMGSDEVLLANMVCLKVTQKLD